MNNRSLLTADFIKVIAVNVLFHMSFTAFFLLPLLIKSLGGNEADIGLIMGASGFASVLMIPVVGSLVDRFGRKIFLVYGTIIMSIASLLYIFITDLSIPAFIFLRILQGVGFAFTFIAAQTIAVDIVPDERRAEGLGLFGVFTMTTHAIGPAIAELIQVHFGYSALFILSGFFGVAAMFFALKLNETHTVKQNFINPLKFIAENHHLTGILLATTICGAGFGSVLVFIPTYMKELSLNPISSFFLSYTAAAILTRLFFGHLADKYDRGRIVLPSMLFYGLSIIALIFVRNIFTIASIAVAFGIAHGLIYPAMGAIVVDNAKKEKGKAMAFYSGAFNIGVTMSSFIYGFLANSYSYETMYITSGIVVIIGMLILKI